MRNRTSKIWGGIMFILGKTGKSSQLMPFTDETSANEQSCLLLVVKSH
jgi:hypothetical protein